MNWKNGKGTSLPRGAIDHKSAEICVELKVDLTDNVGDFVADCSTQGEFSDDKQVQIGFLVGLAAGYGAEKDDFLDVKHTRKTTADLG